MCLVLSVRAAWLAPLITERGKAGVSMNAQADVTYNTIQYRQRIVP